MMATLVSVALCAILGIFALGGFLPLPLRTDVLPVAFIVFVVALIALAVALHFVAP